MKIGMSVRDKMRSGMKPKQAIAKSLAEDYMAEKNGSVDSGGDMGESGEAIYPEGSDDMGLSENVEAAGKLAAALTSYAANENKHSFTSDASVSGHEIDDPEESESMMGDEKPMVSSTGLSDDQKEALRLKKMKRRFTP